MRRWRGDTRRWLDREMPAECQGRAFNQGGSEGPCWLKYHVQQSRRHCTAKAKKPRPRRSRSSPFRCPFFTCIFSTFRGRQPIKRHPGHLLTRCRDGRPRLGSGRPPMMDLTVAWFFTCALRVSESTRRRHPRDVGCGHASRGCDTIGWREQAMMV